MTDKNLKDMQELGLSPSFLIGHVGYWGWVFQQTIFGKEKVKTKVNIMMPKGSTELRIY